MFQHILQLQLCNFEKSYNYIAFALSTMSVLDFLVKQEKPLLEISIKGQCQSHSVDVRSMTIYSFIYDVPVIVINMTFKPIQIFDRGNSLQNWKRRDHTAVVYQCKPKCTQSLRHPLSKRDQPTNGGSLVGLRQLINIWVRGSGTAWYCSVLPGITWYFL